jgi:hypothetical protein
MMNHQPAAAAPIPFSTHLHQEQQRQGDICRHRRNERVHKLLMKTRAKARYKFFRESTKRNFYWSPRHSYATGAAAAGDHDWSTSSSSTSDSENRDGDRNLRRKVKNRESAKASRDKENHLIETLPKKIECLENEKNTLLSFLSRLPQPVLDQIQDSDHDRQLLSSFLEFA